MSAESVPVRTPRVATEPSVPLTPVGETCLSIFAHLSGLFGIIGPFVVFCVLNERSGFARRQALEAINFQITYLLAIPVALFFTALDPNWRSFGPIVVLLAAAFIFPIIGAASAGAGKHYRYPVAIRFIKVKEPSMIAGHEASLKFPRRAKGFDSAALGHPSLYQLAVLTGSSSAVPDETAAA